MKKLLLSRTIVALLTVCLSGATSNFVIHEAYATHKPADKIFASASTLEVTHTQIGPGATSSGPITLLTAVLRTSSPTDLLLQVTAESVLVTDLDPLLFPSQTVATIRVWVEIDGVPVPVTSVPAQGGPDDGKVVFNNRDFRIDPFVFTGIEDIFIKSRSANAFNWAALNVGAGVHTIEVKAELETEVTGIGIFATATAGVGKRTLVVEPGKMANDITV